MKIVKSEHPQKGFSMEGLIGFGVFLQNGMGQYYFSESNDIYGYWYSYMDTHNSPRAIEEIKRK